MYVKINKRFTASKRVRILIEKKKSTNAINASLKSRSHYRSIQLCGRDCMTAIGFEKPDANLDKTPVQRYKIKALYEM